MLLKVFNYIYLLFSVFLLGSVLMERSKLELFLIVVFTILLCFFIKKGGLKFNFSNKTTNLLIILSIVVRGCFLFFNFGDLFSDYANFFNCSAAWAKGGGINKYIATFPHLIPYIVSLGTFFKMFGSSIKSMIIFNTIFDLLSALLLKRIFNSKKAALIWLLNPINIIWCGICHPVAITNTFIIMSILVFKNVVAKFDKENFKLYFCAILFGIVLSVANLYRPIMIILFIAVVIWLFLRITRNSFKKILLIILLIFISYFGCNKLYAFVNKKFIDDTIATQTVGWNIYVGANIDSSGTWNRKQQDEFDEIFYTDATPTEIQEHFLEKGLNLYKNNGLIDDIKLFIKKAIILVKNPDRLTCTVFFDTLELTVNKYVSGALKVLTMLVYYILILFNLIIAYVKLKDKKCDITILLQLFIIGIVASHIFVEVSPRYSLPLLVPYTLLIIINSDVIIKFLISIRSIVAALIYKGNATRHFH